MQTLDNIIGTTVRLFKIGFCGLLAISLASLFIWPDQASRLLLAAAAWHSWGIPKVIVAIGVAVNWQPITRFIWKKGIRRAYFAVLDLPVFLIGGSDFPSECIEDVPRVEILDHLFRNGTLLRNEAEVAFRLPRYRVTAIKQNLERVGVLVRGPNNSHVLNPEFSRQDVAAVLETSSTAAGLKPLFRKTASGSFTSKPSAAEVKERVEELLDEEYDAAPLLSKAPGFETSILAA